MAGRYSIWKYIRNYKFESLLVKNFALIFALIVLPFSGIAFGIYSYYDRILQDEIGAANRNTLVKVRDVMDMIIKEVDKLTIRLAADKFVEAYLVNKKDVFPGFDTINVLQNVTSTISIFASDYIESIYIYSDLNDYVLSSLSGGISFQRFTDKNWFDEYAARSSSNQNKWVLSRTAYIPETERNSTFVSFFFRGPISAGQKNGVIIVNLGYDRLNNLIGRTGPDRVESIYMLDGSNKVLFAPDMQQSGTTFDLLGSDDLAELREGRSIMRDIDGERIVFSYLASGYNDWQYVSAIPLSIYGAKMQQMRQFIWIMITSSLFVSMVVAFLISVRMFKPIRNIMSMLDNPEEYFDIVKDSQSREIANEYKYIASNIIQTFDESKHLEKELEYRMQLLRQSQTLALQSQISPHFLYNTLQTINWLAMDLTHGENKASHVIGSLSRILRVIMETGSTLIPLRDEIMYAREYIGIQKIRYKNKFDAVWDIDDTALDYAIAKITLQPIIENAIYHGIKPSKSKGMIHIQVRVENDTIAVNISDDGVGMPEQAIRILNDEMTTDYTRGDQHIGIKNVNQRIKLIFGEEFGLSLAKGDSGGLNVQILIPKVKLSHPDQPGSGL